MMTLLEELQARGCIHDSAHLTELADALNKGPITFYCGFDPTADSLHAGSMLPLLMMRRLQARGHKPIVLLGSATGMIGDPSGRSEERKLLDEATVEKNLRGIEKQIALFLKKDGANGFSIVENNAWLGKIGLVEFLRDIGKLVSVNTMLGKESVKARLEQRDQGISYTEFSYMLLQAYDFLHLYQQHQCILQVGGSDQWGNITAGMDLVRRKVPSAQAFGLTFPLLTTAAGAKFGKTAEGAVWLDGARTSPYRFYQFWLNTADADVVRFLKLFTEFSLSEIAELEAKMKSAPEKREAQLLLAKTLTEMVHGVAETARAISASNALFGGDLSEVPTKTLLDIFAEVPSVEVAKTTLAPGLPLTDLLVTTELANSKGAARRAIEGGGIYLNNHRIDDPSHLVLPAHLIDQTLLILRSGKKKYVLVRAV